MYYRSKREITKVSSIIKKSIIWKLTRHFHVSTTAFFYQRPGLTERQTWWNCVRRVISYGIHLSIVAVAFVRFWEIYNLQQVDGGMVKLKDYFVERIYFLFDLWFDTTNSSLKWSKGPLRGRPKASKRHLKLKQKQNKKKERRRERKKTSRCFRLEKGCRKRRIVAFFLSRLNTNVKIVS